MFWSISLLLIKNIIIKINIQIFEKYSLLIMIKSNKNNKFNNHKFKNYMDMLFVLINIFCNNQ